MTAIMNHGDDNDGDVDDGDDAGDDVKHKTWKVMLVILEQPVFSIVGRKTVCE